VALVRETIMYILIRDSAPKPAVIRNAGGRAVDAVRSLVVLNSLAKIGVVLVVHHTGMDSF
jgi:hypothetical protein